jgi:hypothetical protein
VASGGAPDHRQQAKDAVDLALGRHPHLPAALQQEYRAAAHAIFDQMTPAALERFNRHVSGYRFFRDGDELSAHAVPGFALLSPALRPYFVVSGAYNRRTQELELAGGGRLAGQGVTPQTRYAHEFGHAIDGPDFEISDTPEWQGAWAAEIRPSPPNPNAATNAREGFSAFAGLAYGTGADRAALEQSHPRCVAVWRAWNLW